MEIPKPRLGSFEEILPDRLGIDVRALAGFRIGLGLVLLADVALRALHVSPFLTDAGVVPRGSLSDVPFPWNLSPFMWSGEAWLQGVLLATLALAAVALMGGFRTRVATVVAWFLLASLQARNPHILQGGDDLLLVLLFWSMFLPLGATWSVDRALDSSDDPPPRRIVSMATAALLLQVLLIYLFTAIHKFHPAWIPEGRAAQYALMLEQFTTPWAAVALQAGPLLRVATWATLIFEFFAPLALLSPWLSSRMRFGVVLAFFGMHLGFLVLLRLGLFPFVSMVGWIPFVPSFVWDRLAGWTRQVRPVRREVAFVGGAHSRRPLRWRASTATQVLVLVLIGYTAAWNVVSLGPRQAVPDAFAWLGRTLAIEQNWRMFAPYPLRYSGRIYVSAEIGAGERRVTGPTAAALAERPPVAEGAVDRLLGWENEYVGRIRLARASAPYYRWRKFHQHIEDTEELRDDYLRFLCGSYSRLHPEAAPPERMSLVLVRRTVSHRTHDWGPVEEEILAERACPPAREAPRADAR